MITIRVPSGLSSCVAKDLRLLFELQNRHTFQLPTILPGRRRPLRAVQLFPNNKPVDDLVDPRERSLGLHSLRIEGSSEVP